MNLTSINLLCCDIKTTQQSASSSASLNPFIFFLEYVYKHFLQFT